MCKPTECQQRRRPNCTMPCRSSSIAACWNPSTCADRCCSVVVVNMRQRHCAVIESMEAACDVPAGGISVPCAHRGVSCMVPLRKQTVADGCMDSSDLCSCSSWLDPLTGADHRSRAGVLAAPPVPLVGVDTHSFIVSAAAKCQAPRYVRGCKRSTQAKVIACLQVATQNASDSSLTCRPGFHSSQAPETTVHEMLYGPPVLIPGSDEPGEECPPSR